MGEGLGVWGVPTSLFVCVCVCVCARVSSHCIQEKVH